MNIYIYTYTYTYIIVHSSKGLHFAIPIFFLNIPPKHATIPGGGAGFGIERWPGEGENQGVCGWIPTENYGEE